MIEESILKMTEAYKRYDKIKHHGLDILQLMQDKKLFIKRPFGSVGAIISIMNMCILERLDSKGKLEPRFIDTFRQAFLMICKDAKISPPDVISPDTIDKIITDRLKVLFTTTDRDEISEISFYTACFVLLKLGLSFVCTPPYGITENNFNAVIDGVSEFNGLAISLIEENDTKIKHKE